MCIQRDRKRRDNQFFSFETLRSLKYSMSNTQLTPTQLADCNIVNCFAKLAANIADYEVGDLHQILSTFAALHTTQGPHLSYSTIPIISAILVFYTSPLLFQLSDVYLVIEFLLKSCGSNLELEEANDIEEFAHFLAQKVGSISTHHSAELVIKDINEKCVANGFDIGDVSVENRLLKVIDARLRINSEYIDDLELLNNVKNFIDSNETAQKWSELFYRPYKYYWDNYASLTDRSAVKFHEICQMHSSDSLFEALISPVSRTSFAGRLSVGNWMDNVIVPILAWKNYDMSPVEKWMFATDNSTPRKQQLWNTVFFSFVKHEVPFENYLSIVKNFIINSYYDTTKDNNMSSIEMLKTFDLIRESIIALIPIAPKGQNVAFGDVTYENEDFATVEEFAGNSSLTPLFEATKDNLISLSEIIDTCSKLYPINQITVGKFLKLKYSRDTSKEDFRREVSRILVGLRPHNATQLLSTLDLFKSVFIQQDEDEDLNVLVTERFLLNNLFDRVVEFYESGKISAEILYNLVVKKIWDSITNATSFDDRSGKLHEASSCIAIADKMGQDLSKSNREEIVKLKHLMKVFSNVKNFRLQLDRKSPVPYDLIKRFGSLPSNEELRTDLESVSPMGLITSILEQNLKLYLAFERLFKILNDFLLFLNDDIIDSSYYFQRLMAACIEASLIDNNFNYAYKKSVELLEQYADDNLNHMWMTFYQVGNYKSPDWSMGQSIESQRVEILTKQSEILAKYLKTIDRMDVSSDNSRIIVSQWDKVNEALDEWYEQFEAQRERTNTTSSRQLQENITATAQEILNDAANTTSQASDKLSNLLVSGLAWTIGAKH